jgi:N6-adenosine-specific RNA methylase IME4
MALIAIKEKKLYRSKYGTFESYVSERWKLSRSHAYQLVNAAHTYQNLAALKNDNKNILLPANEVQIRSLTSFPEDIQQSIWLKGVENANGKQPTGKEIKYLVDNLSTNGKNLFRKVSKVIQKSLTEERKIKRIQKLEEESRNFAPITSQLGKFSVIIADPPWSYEHSASENRVIENHYNTMSIEEIAALPVNEICTKTAVLFLWVTNPKLQEGLYVLNQWGFTYRTCMVWVKDRIGTGYWVRSRHELLLIGIKGKMPCPEESLRPASVIESKRRKHSEKPDKVYEIIEKMYPSLKKIELFARKKREGWQC